MKVFEHTIDDLSFTYPLDALAPLEQVLFFDIETTGFSPKHCNLYLIGAIYYKDNTFHLKQWFASTLESERTILMEFINFSEQFSYFAHFNGNQFDIPFLIDKCKQHKLNESFLSKEGIDLYKRILPYKRFLNLPNLKQKTIETFLNIKRTDIYNGGELISMYKEYLSCPSVYYENHLLIHNAEDVLGLILILPILSYIDILNRPSKVTKVQANSYLDFRSHARQELVIHFTLTTPIPMPISYQGHDCYFTASENTGKLKIPIFSGELKHFYANYKDYYYLPAEDLAIHKSVASYVTVAHREKATASNCYTKKKGSFLPQWEPLVHPFFKESYKSTQAYFEITDDLKSNRDFFTKYTLHVFEHIIKH